MGAIVGNKLGVEKKNLFGIRMQTQFTWGVLNWLALFVWTCHLRSLCLVDLNGHFLAPKNWIYKGAFT